MYLADIACYTLSAILKEVKKLLPINLKDIDRQSTFQYLFNKLQVEQLTQVQKNFQTPGKNYEAPGKYDGSLFP